MTPTNALVADWVNDELTDLIDGTDKAVGNAIEGNPLLNPVLTTLDNKELDFLGS